MKHSEDWRPTKFLFSSNGLRPNPDKRFLSPGSWLMAKLVAEEYGRYFTAYAKGRLLDLGCGYVPMYQAYKSRVEEITCVDWSNSRHPNPHLDMVADLTRPTQLLPSAFDVVVLSDVLEHLPNPSELLNEIARVLKPSGVLLMNVPFMYWLHEEPHDYYRYTEHGLRYLLTRAGFKIESLVAVGGGLFVFADVVGKHLVKLPLAGGFLAGMLQRSVYAFCRIPTIQRMTKASSRKMPMAYFVVASRMDKDSL
jgi:SAM-dependent methyltransferase